MKKISVILSFLFLLIYHTFQSWASPACPSSRYFQNCFGTYITPEGDKYIGEYKNGKKHGQSTFTYASGEIYIGEYKDDKRNGQGAFTWVDVVKDLGEFSNDLLNGFAFRYDKNENILKEGTWKDDKFQHAQKQSHGSSN